MSGQGVQKMMNYGITDIFKKDFDRIKKNSFTMLNSDDPVTALVSKTRGRKKNTSPQKAVPETERCV